MKPAADLVWIVPSRGRKFSEGRWRNDGTVRTRSNPTRLFSERKAWEHPAPLPPYATYFLAATQQEVPSTVPSASQFPIWLSVRFRNSLTGFGAK